MVRNIVGTDLKVNVYMKDGNSYECCDVTNNVFGDEERMVSFWYNNKIRIIPISEVYFVELYTIEDQKDDV